MSMIGSHRELSGRRWPRHRRGVAAMAGGGWLCQMCVFRPVPGSVAWSWARLTSVRIEAFARYHPIGYEEPDIMHFAFDVTFR